MGDTKTRLGAGDVEIELDGETVTLKPTLKAGTTLSRQHGGFVEAIRKVGQYDLDTTIQVVMLGLDARGSHAKEIPEKVYSSGLTNLAGPVIRYLHILANGGRPPEDAPEPEGDDEENPPQASA